MKKKKPRGANLEMGEKEHGKLIAAVVLAVFGVAFGVTPYFVAAKIIVLLLAGESAFFGLYSVDVDGAVRISYPHGSL